ncbi:uncharacterized protein LOC119608552 [Lucilia sericata]|uniref:uncharacterized protein LOC119608552 n=1 Tax=Lucilia sericata TaxID=13632 RepID=UPI0018A80905|nr:uncharacterized protein LOC119608552 [Lucilia sericata]
MSKLKILNLISFVLLMAYLPSIQSDCVIQYPTDEDTLPKYEKVIGKFKIRVPYNGNPIKLYDGETIHVHCDTFLNSINYQTKERSSTYDYHYGYREVVVDKSILNKNSITLKCRNNKLVYDNIELSQNKFSCMHRNWTIYSTKQPYTWCQNNQNSSTFLLATKPSTDNFVLAAICYNMEQIALQTVVYNVSNLRRNYLNQPMDVRTTNMIPSEYLDENLWNLKFTTLSDLSGTLLKEKLTNLAKTDRWLSLANYEVSSIVQDEMLKKYFKEYDNLLNIIWWRNLRLGNWQRFLNTLKNYAYSNSFEIYTGTSGVAEYPADDKCHKERRLEMKFGFKNETIPAYIWTYLKSYDNLNQEFIIVGYNSPYAEYFTTENVIFCPDICAEIPWLNEIYTSFRYAYAGIMFCCSTDFIRQTNYLQGFPMDILLSSHLETTTTEVETTTIDWDITTYY